MARDGCREVLGAGGNGPGVIDRAAAFGDVWFPNFARGNVLERWEAAFAELNGE